MLKILLLWISVVYEMRNGNFSMLLHVIENNFSLISHFMGDKVESF